MVAAPAGSATLHRPAAAGSVGRGMATRDHLAVPRRRRRPGRAAHAGLVHAPGRAQPARVPGRARRGVDPRRHQAPGVAAEITLQPVRRYGVDAAVLYSDIVVPPHAVGFGIDVAPGTGPVAAEPLRDRAGLARLRAAGARRHRLRRRDGRRRGRRARRRRARAGLRRRPVHRGQLPDRGPAEPDLRAHQGPAAHRRGAVARRDGRGWPTWR